MPRVARSSLSAEIQGASEGQEESEFVRLVMADVLFGPVDLSQATDAIASIPATLVLDCKALWDSIARSESSALGMKDKRVAIEALALRRGLTATKTALSWVHSLAQLADSLTKDTEVGRGILLKCLRTGWWRLVYDSRFMSARKRASQGLDVLATPEHPDEDHDVYRGDPRNKDIVVSVKSKKHDTWAHRSTVAESPA